MNSELISVATFFFRPEAERAQQVLESVGIASVVSGDDASGWAPHVGLGTGGVAVSVHRADAERAQEVLAEAGGNE